MSDVAAAEAGLRERKKTATRQALARAAVRLAMERGIENVRVEDIAADAGVSPRTFNNYFASKEAAILSLNADRSERIAAAIRERPADEGIGAAILAAYGAIFARMPEREAGWMDRLRLVVMAPELRGEYLKSLIAGERPLANAIAARLGLDPNTDLYPRLLAAAVSAAERVAYWRWMQKAGAITLGEAMTETIGAVLQGFEGRPG